MKIKKQYFKWLLIYLILREFIPFSPNLYRSNAQWNSSHNSTTNSTSLGAISKYNEYSGVNLDKGDTYRIIFDGLYDDETLGSKEKDIKVSVTKKVNISPLRYIPLIKFILFTSEIPYRWSSDIYNNGKKYFIRGSGKIKGTLTIFGIMSGKDAKEQIQLIINSEIEKCVRSEIDDNINSTCR